MTTTQLYDDLSTRLERLQYLDSLVDQFDALGLSLELALSEPSADEAELERRRLDAYVSMIREHNRSNTQI